MRVKASRPRHVVLLRCISTSGPMISCTSPPEQKLPPAPVDHDGLDVLGIDQVAERVAQLGVGFERERILALGPVERDRRDLAVELPEEVLRPEVREIDARAVKTLGCISHGRTLFGCAAGSVSAGQRQPAADAQHLAGDVVGRAPREEQDGVGDLLRLARCGGTGSP